MNRTPLDLTDKEEKFIKNRAQRARAWPFVGGFLLCLVFSFGAWLFLYRLLLATNPVVVLMKLNEASIPSSTLILMAAMLPFFVFVGHNPPACNCAFWFWSVCQRKEV